MNIRATVFGALVVVVAAACTIVALNELKSHDAQASRAVSSETTTVAKVERGPRIVFRHTGPDSEYGVVAEVSLSDAGGPRAFTGASCDRV
ncbi:MAG: hypothetical protein J2O46_08695, partial [Nocardioides sp.]|nr:hypothetical protein [Nocardioides sp.]